MILTSEEVYLTVDGSPMRVLVTAPKTTVPTTYPGIVMYSDIFQLTGPQLRVSRRLAGYGFVVATPEIYHRIEPAGAAIPFDDDGRTRGQANARKTAVTEMDADARSVLDWLSDDPRVTKGRKGAMGFCIGGHLALRAALQPDVLATASFYPTGVHNGALGKDEDAGTLARTGEIRGELLLVYGTRDPHVPATARQTIDAWLRAAGTRFTTKLFDAEHAFLRDEGPRWDPEASDEAWREAVLFLRRALVGQGA